MEEGEVLDAVDVGEGSAEEVFQFHGVEEREDVCGDDSLFGKEKFEIGRGAGGHDGGHAGEDVFAVMGEESSEEELAILDFFADDGFVDEVELSLSKEVDGFEVEAGDVVVNFVDAEDEVEAVFGDEALVGVESMGVGVDPMLSGSGVEFGDDVIEDEPFEASAYAFELSFIAVALAGFEATEKGELGAGSVGADDGVVDGFGHDAFDDV